MVNTFYSKWSAQNNSQSDAGSRGKKNEEIFRDPTLDIGCIQCNGLLLRYGVMV